jgi:hypothetical protein
LFPSNFLFFCFTFPLSLFPFPLNFFSVIHLFQSCPFRYFFPFAIIIF